MKAVFIVIGVAEKNEAGNGEEIPMPTLDIAKVFQPTTVVARALAAMLQTRFPLGARTDDEAMKISNWLSQCLSMAGAPKNVQDH